MLWQSLSSIPFCFGKVHGCISLNDLTTYRLIVGIYGNLIYFDSFWVPKCVNQSSLIRCWEILQTPVPSTLIDGQKLLQIHALAVATPQSIIYSRHKQPSPTAAGLSQQKKWVGNASKLRNHFNNLLTIVWLFLSAHRAASDHDFHAFLATKEIGSCQIYRDSTAAAAVSIHQTQTQTRIKGIQRWTFCFSNRNAFSHPSKLWVFEALADSQAPMALPILMYSHHQKLTHWRSPRYSFVFRHGWLKQFFFRAVSTQVSCCQSVWFWTR